jgi:beta-lactamase superfamily II metal-dependent hydrolase
MSPDKVRTTRKQDIDNLSVRFLEANYGDSILISFKQHNETKNILIDGGTSATYMRRDRRKGALKEALENLGAGKINLLIVTHVDNDHICGVLKWLESDTSAYQKIEEVWFNAEEHVAHFLTQRPMESHRVKLKIYDSGNVGYTEGKTLEEYLTQKNNIVWTDNVICAGQEFTKFNGMAHFKILSPDRAKLELLLKEWETDLTLEQEDYEDTNVAARGNDYKLSLQEHLKNDSYEKFKEDDAPHNGSSIAFILTIQNKRLLFLADAHPTVIVQSLKDCGYTKEKPLEVELVKLSHHGSRYNNSRELLEMINSKNFIISTNGGGQAKHPHKRLLARLISIHKTCQIYFNYPDLIDIIFQDGDYVDFPEFKALPAGSFSYEN